MAITREKVGAIAIEILKYSKRKEGLKLVRSEMIRDIGNIAQESGIDQEEIKDAFLFIIEEMARDAMCPRVKVIE